VFGDSIDSTRQLLPGANALSMRNAFGYRNNCTEMFGFLMISSILSLPWRISHQLNFYLGASS